jgi:hypothetical protein
MTTAVVCIIVRMVICSLCHEAVVMNNKVAIRTTFSATVDVNFAAGVGSDEGGKRQFILGCNVEMIFLSRRRRVDYGLS